MLHWEVLYLHWAVLDLETTLIHKKIFLFQSDIVVQPSLLSDINLFTFRNEDTGAQSPWK